MIRTASLTTAMLRTAGILRGKANATQSEHEPLADADGDTLTDRDGEVVMCRADN